MKSKTKKKLIRNIILTVIFGSVEIGVMFLSNYISTLYSSSASKGLFIGLTLLVFFIISYVFEFTEDLIK